MLRPSSIVRFERLYLGSLALWLLERVLYWPQARAAAAANPAYAGNPQLAQIVGPMIVGATLVVAVASLLFWYLVARRASVVGKWLVVVTEALGGLFLLLSLARLASGRVTNMVDFALGAAVTLLAIAAAVMLFQPDAERWFRGAADLPERFR